VSRHRTTKAIKKGFVYPANATVKKGGGLVASIWPANPWTGAQTELVAPLTWPWPQNANTGAPMTLSTAIGHYGYTHTGSSFTLTGHLSGGKRYTVTKTLADID
jgi:hypothetical protein